MYKLGKLPARPGAVTFKLRNYVAATRLPSSAGHYKLFGTGAWGMFGNDQYGDCVCAGAAHETMLWNREAGKTISIGTPEALLMYHDVAGFDINNPATDQGTDMQAAASWRRKTGLLDANSNRHKVDAYLDITAGNVDQLKQAIYLFGAVGVGIQFPNSAMAQFDAGKPWSIKNSSIEGGHYVPAVGYDRNYVYVVTWGKLQKMTWGFYKKYCDEAIAYVSQESLTNGKSLEGFDFATLEKDLAAL